MEWGPWLSIMVMSAGVGVTLRGMQFVGDYVNLRANKLAQGLMLAPVLSVCAGMADTSWRLCLPDLTTVFCTVFVTH